MAVPRQQPEPTGGLKPAAADALRREAIAITSLGGIALTILHASERGFVLAVFRRSFYVRLGNDVVCFGPAGLGRGPLNALCKVPDALSWPDVGLESDVDVLRSAATLRVGSRLRFDFASAGVWRPPIAPAYSLAALARGLDRLAASARRRSPGGLGALLSTLPGEFAVPPGGSPDLLLPAAAPAIFAVRRWLAAALAGSAEPSPAMDTLVGLGPGLTPAGDDFLCGAMTALHYFGHAAIAKRLADRILPVAARDTSLISAAYLRCAAMGHASSVLFDVLESLLAGGNADLEQRLDAAHAVGHTSGWDTLAGAAAVGAELVAASAPRAPANGRRRTVS